MPSAIRKISCFRNLIPGPSSEVRYQTTDDDMFHDYAFEEEERYNQMVYGIDSSDGRYSTNKHKHNTSVSTANESFLTTSTMNYPTPSRQRQHEDMRSLPQAQSQPKNKSRSFKRPGIICNLVADKRLGKDASQRASSSSENPSRAVPSSNFSSAFTIDFEDVSFSGTNLLEKNGDCDEFVPQSDFSQIYNEVEPAHTYSDKRSKKKLFQQCVSYKPKLHKKKMPNIPEDAHVDQKEPEYDFIQESDGHVEMNIPDIQPFSAYEQAIPYHQSSKLSNVQILDSLACMEFQNLQQNIDDLKNTSGFQRMNDYQTQSEVPQVVGYGASNDLSDSVSEFGMGSIYGSKSETGRYEKTLDDSDDYHDDYGPPRIARNRMRDDYGPVGGRNYRSETSTPMGSQWEEKEFDRVNRSYTEKKNEEFLMKASIREHASRYSNKGIIPRQSKDAFSSQYEGEEQLQSFGRIRQPPLSESRSFEKVHQDHRLFSAYQPTSVLDSSNELDEPSHHYQRQYQDMPPHPRHRVRSYVRPRSSQTEEAKRKEQEFHFAVAETNQRKNIARTETFSEASSGVSRFSRSSKYRELLSAPMKIQRDDRKSSVESELTHKWSNMSSVRSESEVESDFDEYEYRHGSSGQRPRPNMYSDDAYF